MIFKMKKLNYGVVGCGVFGEYQINGVAKLTNANLVALCDVNMERCKEMAEKFGVEKLIRIIMI